MIFPLIRGCIGATRPALADDAMTLSVTRQLPEGGNVTVRVEACLESADVPLSSFIS